MTSARILVTGGAGYLGRQVVAALARAMTAGGALRPECIVSLDVRETPAAQRLAGVVHVSADIRSAPLQSLLREHAIDTVVHLAAIRSRRGARPIANSSTRSMSKARARCSRPASPPGWLRW